MNRSIILIATMVFFTNTIASQCAETRQSNKIYIKNKEMIFNEYMLFDILKSAPGWNAQEGGLAIFPELSAVSTYITIPVKANPERIVTQWLVEDGMLYLKELEPVIDDNIIPLDSSQQIIDLTMTDKIDYSSYIPPRDEIRRRVERYMGQKFNHRGLMPAVWFSGTLIAGFDYINPRYYINRVTIKIEKGQVTDISITQNKPMPYDNLLKIDQYLTNAITIWEQLQKIDKNHSDTPIKYNYYSKNHSGINGDYFFSNHTHDVTVTEKKEQDSLLRMLSSELTRAIDNIPLDQMCPIIYRNDTTDSLNNPFERFFNVWIYPNKKMATINASAFASF